MRRSVPRLKSVRNGDRRSTSRNPIIPNKILRGLDSQTSLWRDYASVSFSFISPIFRPIAERKTQKANSKITGAGFSTTAWASFRLVRGEASLTLGTDRLEAIPGS